MRITTQGVYIWGLQPITALRGEIWAGELLPIWCSDWEFVAIEFGRACQTNGIIADERDTVIEAERCDTPPEAWVALAYYRLTGKRINDSDFVKE